MTEAEREQRRRHAVIVLALQRAKDAVRASIKAHGFKLNHYSAKDITIWAELFLEEHRDALLAEAKTAVERMVAEGVFGKRAQREQCAKLLSEAQQPGHCSFNQISVQNS